MNTIASKLNYLLDTKTAIKNAIISKGVAINDNDTFRSYADKINSISQGTPGVTRAKDLNFYDYDGTILYSYTKEEVANLTELPEGPSHPGLVFDGWSSTLEEAKNFINKCGRWGVGAYFNTDDNTARLYITLTDKTKLKVSFTVYCRWGYKGSVNWGDNTENEFSSESGGVITLYHTYENTGDFVVKFKRISGDVFGFYGNPNNGDGFSIVGDNTLENSYYLGIIRKVEMSKSVYLEGCPFRSCRKLETITFPSTNPTVNNYFTRYSFNDCSSLKHICGMMSYGFTGCANNDSLKVAIFRFKGDSGNTNRLQFYNCTALEEVYSVGFVNYTRCYDGCTNLKYVVGSYTNTPGNTYAGCRSLKELKLSGPAYLYYDNNNYKGGHFSGCNNLEHVDISSSTTYIGYGTFRDCHSLDYLEMPSSIKEINSYAFQNCASLQYIDFSKHTSVPTLEDANAFTGVPSTCKVYVPSSLFNTWKNASVWKNVASYLVPNIEVTECTRLTLTANNISGNDTTTKGVFTAIVNGYNPVTGEYIEGATYIDEVNIEIPKNLSQTESIEREVRFDFYGKTAYAIIQQSPYVDYKIVCKYNISSTASSTNILYSSFSNLNTYFAHMIIDGVEYPIASSHTFETAGEHEIIFKISDDMIKNSNLYRLFYGITCLKEVDFTMMDMSMATSTSTSNGTAYMLYGCTGLNKIIFPETIKYMGYYMLYNCTNVTEITFKAKTAPTLYGYTSFGAGSNAYVGYTNRNAGINKLYVPVGSTGYNSGYWTSYLQDTAECGFTREEVEF